MARVQVLFWARANVYQDVIEQDLEFHEQNDQLTGLQILVDDSYINFYVTRVQVSFWADADVYQEAINQDLEFHRQQNHLTSIQIMVHEPPQAITIADLKGTAADPILIDDDDGWIRRIPHADPTGPQCSICLDPLSTIRRGLPCKHTFCQACIRKWYRPGGSVGSGRRVNKTCPTCRADFVRRDIF